MISMDKNGTGNNGWQNLDAAESKLISLFRGLVGHPGFGELKVDVSVLRNGKKEVILSSGKKYRFILTQATNQAGPPEAGLTRCNDLRSNSK